MKSLSTGIEFLPLRTCFGILHGQVTRDLLSNLYKPGQSISVSSFRRKPESRLFLTAFWIPACAGMTDQRFFEQVNSDKPVPIYNDTTHPQTKEGHCQGPIRFGL